MISISIQNVLFTYFFCSSENECKKTIGFVIQYLTWLTVTNNLCHKLPRICSVCRNHNKVHALSSVKSCQQVCNKSSTRGATTMKQELLTLPGTSERQCGKYVNHNLLLFITVKFPFCTLFY